MTETVPDTSKVKMGRSKPLYWFKEYWLHRLYSDGVESSVKRLGRRLPVQYVDADGEKGRGNRQLFFWKLLYGIEEGSFCRPNVDVRGYRLFGLVDGKTVEYCPVVEVLRNEENGDEWRLFASKDYEMGDAILFLSEFEEETKNMILGGAYAETSEVENESNVYLTCNRMLRCMKDIGKGEKIVRWRNPGNPIDYFEVIDQVIVSRERMAMGRIGKLEVGERNERITEFLNGTIDVARSRNLLVFEDSFAKV
mmetsp:Transcript_25461/g.62626  ORF Transcript_25461/g.62626 Transcript_25461/m.62626 type:complete len:252 (+) Transcript_25461:94-849(+)|eukprot:CAMPEP_0113627010 /NCGR_PEP_ID=MMETSP0017_2-20120614/13979_1 /TAXON_ID=2856 /ORGANISM="Cylindrotheca closterium" /LENGTH=251 /DNA_ID=CAMNT_0000537231 /DNA_START=63 /DNA_END=818 /DNA_ORIENTATION=+ /assembly_acc=CAM_ASM_000147